MNSNLRQTLWALNLVYDEPIPRKTPQKEITFTMDFDHPKLARVRAQKREKRTIRSAARLGVQSEDLDIVLNAARKESKGPNTWQTQTHQKPRIRRPKLRGRRGKEGNQAMDEISTKKSFYFNPMVDYREGLQPTTPSSTR